MSVFEKACLIIYRYAEKGLEIFLVSDPGEENPVWSIPQREIPQAPEPMINEEATLIELESVEGDDGIKCRAIAIEGDYHDIPSMRSIVKNDVMYVKDLVKTIIPEIEQGHFIAVKEAVKKVLPHEYTFLKELKDILTDRNTVKNL
jgi:hypothetical protein